MAPEAYHYKVTSHQPDLERAVVHTIKPPLHIGEAFIDAVRGTGEGIITLDHVATNIHGSTFAAVVGEQVPSGQVANVKAEIGRRLAFLANYPGNVFDVSSNDVFGPNSPFLRGK